MNRIAFIMPTFNRAHYIAEALDAVTGQMGVDDTVLVVDDGSTDGTSAVIEAYRPRVGYVRQANGGKSAALNFALSLTDSEFVWICDDDDVMAPGAVASLVSALAKDDAGFAFGRHTRFRTEGRIRVDLETGYWPDLSCGSILRHLLEDSFVMQNATLIRRSALTAIGPFDETLARSIDYDMFVRLALAFRGRYVDSVMFAQRQHAGLRGPGTDLHAAAASMDVWAVWDRRVFDKVAANVPLAAFEALFEGDDPLLTLRAALLQRACVWCRHHRWEDAIADFGEAAAIGPTMALHPLERAICARALDGKHGFAALLDAGPVAAGFGAMLARSATGHAAGWSMARGIAWRLRHHNPEERHRARAMLGRIALSTRGRGLLPASWRREGTSRRLLVERTDPLHGRSTAGPGAGRPTP